MLPDPLRSPALAAPHGFFTRLGGVSSGPYASLNCSLSGQDARDAVLQNRSLAARAIGADPCGRCVGGGVGVGPFVVGGVGRVRLPGGCVLGAVVLELLLV